MSTAARTKRSASRVRPWQLALAQVLDEHHLCASSESFSARASFVDDLVSQLSLMDDTQVCVIDGLQTLDIASFGRELGTALGVDVRKHPIDSLESVVWALRRRFTPADQSPVKRRFIVWSEAHELLRQNSRAFSQLVDAMMGVAAESEFASEDLLLLQRCVFIGRSALDVYAEDPTAQFRAWMSEGTERPLWSVVSGQDAPRVRRLPIERDGSVRIAEPPAPPASSAPASVR